MGQVRTVTVSDCVSNNGWHNLTTNEGKISVKEDKCPKLSEKLKGFFPGTPIEVEMDIAEKDGKKYGWDVKEKGKFGGGFKANPRKDALTLAVQLVCSGKVEPKLMIESADKLLKYLNNDN